MYGSHVASLYPDAWGSRVGLALLIEGLAQYRVDGAPYVLSLYLGFLADAYRQLGRVDDGLVAIAEALRGTGTYGNVFWVAELSRLQGELLLPSSVQALGSRVKKSPKSKVQSSTSQVPSTQHLTPGTQEEAEACFLQALAIARQQGAKSLELRAAMSWRACGSAGARQPEAHRCICDLQWFTKALTHQRLTSNKSLLGA